jgi:hypothetical protein
MRQDMPRKIIPNGPGGGDIQSALCQFLRRELETRGIRRRDFAKKFWRFGRRETDASIRNKLARGTFSAVFFLQSLELLGHREFPCALVMAPARTATRRRQRRLAKIQGGASLKGLDK